MAKDPVCGMTVKEASAPKSTFEGNTYEFCSTSCKTKFDKEPKKYTPRKSASA